MTLTKAEARRRVARGAATLLDDGSINLWLEQDDNGDDLAAADHVTMVAARDELVAWLKRRARLRSGR